jgi:hypothetical protein
MQTHSILRAKIQELEEAFLESARAGNVERSQFYNRELVYYLIKLANVIGNPTPDRGTDSGEL